MAPKMPWAYFLKMPKNFLNIVSIFSYCIPIHFTLHGQMCGSAHLF